MKTQRVKLLFLGVDSRSHHIYYMKGTKREEIKEMMRNATFTKKKNIFWKHRT
jgi:hypothetical protein